MGETGTLALISFESLPVGCRFHPTDEELINHYLKRKIDGRIKPCDAAVMPEVDVCRFEPWDLPDKSPIRSRDPEWFFFAPVDRKYPSGNRSNRATEAGYWKATGKDRQIKSKVGGWPTGALIGMKKTLVFHRGRAPKGTRTNWIMHEYRTVEPEFESDQGGFVLCRLFRKPEDTLSCSSSNEVQRTVFSSPNMSSPGSMLSGADGLEEFATPLNQASPHSGLLEELLSLPEITDKERAGGVDEVRHLIPHPLKPEEKQCTSYRTSDVGGYEAQAIREAGAPMFDDLAEFLGSEYQHLFSDEILLKSLNQTSLEYPPHGDAVQGGEAVYFEGGKSDQGGDAVQVQGADAVQVQGDGAVQGMRAQLPRYLHEEDSVTELLDTMVCSPEDHSAEVSNYQADSAMKIMPECNFCEIECDSTWKFESEAPLKQGEVNPIVSKGSSRALPNFVRAVNTRNRQMLSSESPIGFYTKQGEAERRIRLQSSIGAGIKREVVNGKDESGLISMGADKVGRDYEMNVAETAQKTEVSVPEDIGNYKSDAAETSEITEVDDDECSSTVEDAVMPSEGELPVSPQSTLRLRVKQIAVADGDLETYPLHEMRPNIGLVSVRRVCIIMLVIMLLVCAVMRFFNFMGG